MGERMGDTELWVRVREVAYDSLRRRGYPHELAEDAAQDTLLELQKALAKGVEIANPGGWASTTAFRRAVDRTRKERLVRPEQVDMRETVGRFLAEGAPVSARGMQREQLARLVEELTDRELDIAWLTAEGLKQAEIAEALGVGTEAVRKALQRLRKGLRERADELGIDVEVLDHPRPY
jgi:RNA polymerase sigma factor (sigma-70 family)